MLLAAALRVLGKSLGVSKIRIGRKEARVNFRNGVIPKLTSLEGPLRDRQVDVQVRRMHPLSLAVKQLGVENLAETLIDALRTLLSEHTRTV